MVGRLLAHSHGRGAASIGGDDLTDANLPPPSTLAAQLVKNHVDTARGLNQPDTTVTFRQLLQEILSKSSVPETDVDVNHKLIKVVVEAGLDVLFQDDPFAQWDFLIPQAIDSLAVIQSTIQRQPDILFHNASTNSDQNPHLLLWLFPKLLMLSKHPKGAQLQESLASLLSSLVLSLSKTLDLWPYAKALLTMLRDCATDLFVLLQDSRVCSKSAVQVPAVLLPPVRNAELQKELASVVEKLIDRYDAEYGYIIEEFLLPSFRAIAHDTSKFEAASGPLRRVVRQCLQRHDTNGHADVVMSDHIAQIYPELPTSRPAKTKPLRRGLQGLRNPQDSLSSGQSEDVYEKLKHRIAALLGKGTTTDTDSLDVASRYAAMSEAQRSTFWEMVGSCACAATNNLHNGKCSFCDGDRRLHQEPEKNTWEENDRATDWNEMFLMLTELFESQDLQLSDRNRVLAILAVRSIVLHNRNPSQLELGTSFLAEWCLKYLHSSSRELRVAAGRTMAAFLREGLPIEIRNKNRQVALNFLRALSTKDIVGQHETLILAWGRVAVVCGEKELNLALLRLVDYLGHPNSLIFGGYCRNAVSLTTNTPQTILSQHRRRRHPGSHHQTAEGSAAF
ncbi:hypothetical protein KCU71_g12104, partial [Aureobasidium melanogenum]